MYAFFSRIAPFSLRAPCSVSCAGWLRDSLASFLFQHTPPLRASEAFGGVIPGSPASATWYWSPDGGNGSNGSWSSNTSSPQPVQDRDDTAVWDPFEGRMYLAKFGGSATFMSHKARCVSFQELSFLLFLSLFAVSLLSLCCPLLSLALLAFEFVPRSSFLASDPNGCDSIDTGHAACATVLAGLELLCRWPRQLPPQQSSLVTSSLPKGPHRFPWTMRASTTSGTASRSLMPAHPRLRR